MFALVNSLAAAGFVPARLEANMLAAVKAAGGSAWYVPDDFLVLGPELVVVNTASVAGASGYFYSDFTPVVGKSYQITYQYSVTGGTSVQMSLGGSNVPSSTVGSGTVVYTITATNTNPLRCYSNAATATLSGISVKEILSAKDFQDSAGTLPSYLGGTVGLGIDAAGAVGAELLPSYDLTSANWSAIGTPSGITQSGFTNASGTFAGLVIGAATVGMVSGKLYRVSIPYTKSESVSMISARIAAGIDLASSTAASGILTGITTAGTAGLQLRYSNNGAVTFGAISVKEIRGNTIAQSTAGNRPVISRIPRKLGAEKALAANYAVATGGYDNTITGVSQSGFTAVAGTTVSRVALNFPTEIGKTYNIAFRVTSGPASGTTQLYSRDQPSGGGASITTTGTIKVGALYNLQFTATSTSSSVLWVTSANAQSFVVDGVSVKEVFEFSYALTFDGTNDSLAAPASIVGSNLSQPYTMISWGKVGAIGTALRLVGDSARSLGVTTTGKPYATNHGVVNSTGTTTLVAGQSLILESTWDGAMLAIYMNGVKESEIASAAPTAPAGATTIGQRGSGTEYWNSDIGGCVVCPAVMTEAQRAAVRKFAAAQMGLII